MAVDSDTTVPPMTMPVVKYPMGNPVITSTKFHHVVDEVTDTLRKFTVSAYGCQLVDTIMVTPV